MRWLFLKDLQLLKRSPMLVSLLVIYPIAVAALIGIAISAGPGKPKVAYVNLIPESQRDLVIGSQKINLEQYQKDIFERIDPIIVNSRKEAIETVRSGEALGAIVLPANIVERLQQRISLGGGPPPKFEVFYNAEDPVKQQFVDSTVASLLSDANQALSERITEIAAAYLGIIVTGGQYSFLGQKIDILGLERAGKIVEQQIAALPKNSKKRKELERVAGFARLASSNLDLSKPILASIGSPVEVQKTVLKGQKTPLDAFGVAVAATVSLMFVTLLLAAGLLAVEREENVFSRLVRGLVSKTALVVEKIGVTAFAAVVLTLLMLGVFSLTIDIDWSRFHLWFLAIIFSSLAFAALGTLIGSVTREVRTASLASSLIALPLAFAALVPSGVISKPLFDFVRFISALFPFRPALQALDAGLNRGDIAVHLLHLGLLAIAFAVLTRLALRRFA